MKQKVLSLLLVLAMVLSMAPAVLAADANQWEGDIDAVVASVNGTYYSTVQGAIDAANGGVVKLLNDSEEAVTASGDLYLDLNGNTLASLTVNNGTLYGMDSTTNDYDCTDGYGKIVSLTGSYEMHYKSDITGEIMRYLAVEEDTGISFHRFYVGITKVSLQPAVTGFGYKAEFYGDAMVQARMTSIGYSLWLTEGREVTRSTNEFKNILTLRLRNFDVANYGETEVNAKATMILTDGTEIDGEVSSYSMRQMVENVAANFDSYETVQKQAVKTMCETYATMADWNISNILNWTD